MLYSKHRLELIILGNDIIGGFVNQFVYFKLTFRVDERPVELIGIPKTPICRHDLSDGGNHFSQPRL